MYIASGASKMAQRVVVPHQAGQSKFHSQNEKTNSYQRLFSEPRACAWHAQPHMNAHPYTKGSNKVQFKIDLYIVISQYPP